MGTRGLLLLIILAMAAAACSHSPQSSPSATPTKSLRSSVRRLPICVDGPTPMPDSMCKQYEQLVAAYVKTHPRVSPESIHWARGPSQPGNGLIPSCPGHVRLHGEILPE